MSDFLEEVLSAPPPSHRRAPALGLSGSTRRYAAMLTVMAGLTAVPTWIVLKTGANSLSSTAPLQVSPLLAPPVAPSFPQDPVWVPDEPVPPKKSHLIKPPEPAPPAATTAPIEEHKAVVKTPKRPVHKPSKPPAKQPSAPATPAKPTAPSTWPSASASPGAGLGGPPSPWASAAVAGSHARPSVPALAEVPAVVATVLPHIVGATDATAGFGVEPSRPAALLPLNAQQFRVAVEEQVREQIRQSLVRTGLSWPARSWPGSGGPAR